MSAACLAPPGVILGLLAPDRLDEACRTLQAEGVGAITTALPAYLAIFLVNAAIEAPAYGLAARGAGRPWTTAAAQILLLNLATHPIVHYGLPRLAETLDASILAMVVAAEVFAVTVEAALLAGVWHYSAPLAGATAFAANLASWWIGLKLYDLGLGSLI